LGHQKRSYGADITLRSRGGKALSRSWGGLSDGRVKEKGKNGRAQISNFERGTLRSSKKKRGGERGNRDDRDSKKGFAKKIKHLRKETRGQGLWSDFKLT